MAAAWAAVVDLTGLSAGASQLHCSDRQSPDMGSICVQCSQKASDSSAGVLAAFCWRAACRTRAVALPPCQLTRSIQYVQGSWQQTLSWPHKHCLSPGSQAQHGMPQGRCAELYLAKPSGMQCSHKHAPARSTRGRRPRLHALVLCTAPFTLTLRRHTKLWRLAEASAFLATLLQPAGSAA